uniref:Lipase maturation factor 1 n=1 Tax=Leptobrachium leishanense TaxID=445787 RepID=A0A8C5PYT0_9ANUR
MISSLQYINVTGSTIHVSMRNLAQERREAGGNLIKPHNGPLSPLCAGGGTLEPLPELGNHAPSAGCTKMAAPSESTEQPGLRRRKAAEAPTRAAPVGPGGAEDEEKAEAGVSLQPGSFWLTRIVLLRAIAFIYFVAFLVAFHQNKQLIGDKGLLPCRLHLENIKRYFGGRIGMDALSHAPTLFWLFDWSHVDAHLDNIALVGLVISTFVLVTGCANMILMTTLWILYHSLVAVGQIWLGITAFGDWIFRNLPVPCLVSLPYPRENAAVSHCYLGFPLAHFPNHARGDSARTQSTLLLHASQPGVVPPVRDFVQPFHRAGGAFLPLPWKTHVYPPRDPADSLPGQEMSLVMKWTHVLPDYTTAKG